MSRPAPAAISSRPRLVRSVDRLISASRLIDPGEITADARALAAALGEPIQDLARFAKVAEFTTASGQVDLTIDRFPEAIQEWDQPGELLTAQFNLYDKCRRIINSADLEMVPRVND